MVDPAALGPVDEFRTTLQIDGQDQGALHILSFSGRDLLSGLPAYDFVVTSTAEVAAKLDDALGSPTVFQVQRVGDDESIHLFRGVVDEVFPGGVDVTKRLGETHRETHLRIVPQLAELTHTQSSRVFQNLTVVDIAKQLFKLWQIEIDPRLHPEPLPREYCTQVNETDFDFVARILAEDGIHFHLEHGKDKTTVVLVNDPRGYNPIVGKEVIPYREAAGAVTTDHIHGIRRERRIRPGSLSYRDYNFIKPARVMDALEFGVDSDKPGGLAAREFYEYPGYYNDPDEESVGVADTVQRKTFAGSARAQMRLEEQRSHALTFSGSSTSLRMRVGMRFEIQDHTDKAFNGKFIIIRISVGGGHGSAVLLDAGNRSAGAGIEIDFTAVPAETPIRPRVPPKPKAHLRTAKVVGPKMDEPNVDEYGRIRIQFAWDRQGKHDDKSSVWIRMATPVAHSGQGNYIAHRVGAEVLVDFLDGDIDRPIVVSALFNGDNRQPQKLPDDATRAVLYRGLSVPGNKGKNEISCEDKAGKEEIFLHAQKDLNERVLQNHTETVGANQSYTIGANQSFTVGANQTYTVGADRTVTVGGQETITITKTRTETVNDSETVTIQNSRTHNVNTGDDSLNLGAGSRWVDIAKEDYVHSKTATQEVNETIDVGAGTSITIHHMSDATLKLQENEASLHADKKITIDTPDGTIVLGGGKVSITAKSELVLGSGAAKMTFKQDGTISISAPTKVGIAASGSTVTLDPSSAVVNGSSVNVTASGMMEISGSMVKIN